VCKKLEFNSNFDIGGAVIEYDVATTN